MRNRISSGKTVLLLKIIYLFFLFIVAFGINVSDCGLESETIMQFVVYVITIVLYRACLGEWTVVFSSIEFFVLSMYLVYSVFAPLQYIIDGYKPRVFYFPITLDDMTDTTKLYLNIFIQICAWITILGYPRKEFIFRKIKRFCIIRKRVVIADMLALFCLIYFAYLFLRNGLNVFLLYIRSIRLMTDSEINQYIYIYMVAYSFGTISAMIIDRKVKRFDLARIIMISLFWAMSLFVDRKYFILLAIMIIVVILTHIQKTRKPVFIGSILLVIAMIAMGLAREGYLTGKLSLHDTLYYSGTEFVLVEYVSVFYIHKFDFGRQLLNGLSYTYYVLAFFIPHIVFPGKPLTLGEVFYREAHPNVGFAFNPIAEGLMNFGSNSVFTTPILMVLYILFAEKIGKKHPLIYVLMFGYCINIMRGMWAIMVFEIVFFLIIFHLFYSTVWIKEQL